MLTVVVIKTNDYKICFNKIKIIFGTLFGNCITNAEAEKQLSRQNPKP